MPNKAKNKNTISVRLESDKNPSILILGTDKVLHRMNWTEVSGGF